MNAQGMLEQLLKSGLSMIEGKPQAPGARSRQPGCAAGARSGAGAVTGGALGLLLGSKRGRRFGGKALKYGSVAALGLLAYKAYGNWQAQQQAQAGGARRRPPSRAPSTCCRPPRPSSTVARCCSR